MKLAILQSGFLSVENSKLLQSVKDDKIDNFIPMKLSKPVIEDDKPFLYHPGITKVYEEFDADEKIIRSFEFRETVLQEVLDCFNVNNFRYWLDLQRSSKYYSNLHIEFLNDTIKFISEGKRSVNVETWIRLVGGPSLKQENVPKATPTYRSEFNSLFENEALIEAMSCWTSHEGGFKDLLTFCFIVFGKNKSIDIVNRKI